MFDVRWAEERKVRMGGEFYMFAVFSFLVTFLGKERKKERWNLCSDRFSLADCVEESQWTS